MSWLEGAHFTVQTDHKNILQLQKSNAPKVVRWRLAMQQFDYTVVHVEGAGAKHAIADCISRLHGPQKQATLSTAAMTTRAQSSAAKALLESTDISKTSLNQIMRHLRFIVNERRIKTDWSLYLPMVLRILNSEKIAAIGLSPDARSSKT